MNRRTLFGTLAAAAIAGATLPGIAGATEAEQTGPEVWEITLGDPDAAVTLIEYASFTCPHCATFHERVFKPLKADYIDTGKVHFIYREVYFDRYGLWAAMVARCGGPERYFGIIDLIYEQQRNWSGAGGPVEIVAALRRIGLTAGLTEEALDACLQDGEMAQAMVDTFQTNATEHDINSTPSLVINGEKHSNMSYADLRALIDGKLAQ